jgi:hypothetical protein
MADVERLLRRALPPVDPPEDLATRLRVALQSISDLAAEELEGWELSTMRDPRRWVRPAAALIAGSVAGIGLVLIERQRRGRARDEQHASPAPGGPEPS